ncbi:HAD-IB family hydrolase [Kocuria turfanensis]|uniref:Haloacid dehalogenase n=1 Tax=Kocuria turfanensis TaxID=388357 RepID=A0A512IIF6_9MICC|nr:HAD-IB family hydrolase [Kocuria turfanensis]GEO97428.1 haloacid dehalogenase [Kocuria turfanensis]
MTETPTTRVLLTGATGFLGQAVLERLLSAHDGVHVTAVVRPKGSTSGAQRLRQLLRKPAFRTWRESMGERAEQVFAERTAVLEGDLSALAEITEPFDVVIHSASTVSFDPPIHEAFSTNVGGAIGLYDALLSSGQDPHVIHVSTCYVGGIAKGLRPEAPVDHDVDWAAEFDAALRAREEADMASRTPERLQALIDDATAGHGKEGPKSVARAAEAAREEWVRTRLVEYGRTRAQSLGWTDIYTFTKALGERVAEQKWAGAGHRLSVVRPSIIESALRHPYPGWIDGYKVADPLIMAYAKGALPEFPGLPDSVLDVIPVDFVVNAIVALAVGGHRDASGTPTPAGAEAPEPGFYQVCSGASNPLPFHQMYENVLAFFTAHPIQDDEGNPIRVPEWKFPANNAVERSLAVKEKLSAVGGKLTAALPATSRTREWANSMHKMQSGLGSLRTYVDLYQSYTRTEMIFDDARTRQLNDSLPAGTPEDRTFDVRSIDWADYWQNVHLPALTEMTKAYGRLRAASRRRNAPRRTLREGTDVLAVFDLEGTVLNSTVIHQYLQLRRRTLGLAKWPAEAVDLVSSAPTYLKAEKRDRGEFIRAFMRRYEGVPARTVRDQVAGPLGRDMRRLLRPGALARIEEHRAAGHRTVLVTGSIDLLVEPLAHLFDEVVAGRMDERDGVMTGYLATPPLVDEARAQWLKKYAEQGGYDLTRSYGYGDSHADASWLVLMGHPYTVNPDLPLYRLAKKNHWPIEDWKTV